MAEYVDKPIQLCPANFFYSTSSNYSGFCHSSISNINSLANLINTEEDSDRC